VVDWITSLVGRTDGVESHWLSFDGAVMPFVPGERVLGGGGTNFQLVVDYVEGRLEVNGRRFEERADAVIMVTDGHAPQVTPAHPDRWIWLITDGGSDWPERHDPPMACHRVVTGDS
jgi:predicted metal-dependent peptidase